MYCEWRPLTDGGAATHVHRLLPCATAVAAVLALAASGARGATIGVNIAGGDASSGLIGAAQATGAPLARAFLIWPGTAQPDEAKLAAWDLIVNGWARAGMKGIVVVTGNGSPPQDVDAYASYVATLARRYGDKVAGWEVWNEEDEQEWWGAAGGDPALYANLLKATYAAVHPYAPVILGGMVGNDYPFLEKVYEAGGANSFDAVGVHTDTACAIVPPDSFYRDPNGAVDRFSFLGFRSVHDVMTVHGDGAKPILMTEFGWNTYGGVCGSGLFAGKKPAGVSADAQAQYLAQAAHCLSLYPYVSAALWFTLQDGPAPQQYGLLTQGGAKKPSYQAFSGVETGSDSFTGQGCGDFDGPVIGVRSPLDGGKFTGALPIQVEAADNNGVGRISLFADGKKIRNYTTGKTDAKDFPKTLAGVIDWQGAKHLANGNHTIKILALDGSMNTTVRIIKVRKVDPGSLKQIATSLEPIQITGSGTRRTVRTKVTAAVMGDLIPFHAVHHVRLYFQKKVGSGWRTAHKYSFEAKRPVKLTVTLEPATWRVRAVFARKAPFLGSMTAWAQFVIT